MGGANRERAAIQGSRLGTIYRGVARRPGVWAAAGVGLMILGLWVWWATQLWDLPDIGDPFDVAAFQAVHVPPERNAFFEYRDAASMVTQVRRTARVARSEPAWETYKEEWSKADASWRDFAAKTRPALDLWRSGTEKPDYLYEHTGPLNMKTLLPVTQELGILGRMAILEGSRLEESGDMPGAWGWYRAALRSSRHNGRHGFQVERLGGAALHKSVAETLTRWSSDPRVDAALLRLALGEVIAIDAMTERQSNTIKVEYLMLVAALDDSDLIEDVLVANMYGDPKDWSQELSVPPAVQKPIQATRVFLADDRERSLRVVRLMTANWLTQVDKPVSRRTPLVQSDPPIYEADPGTRAPIRPEKLAKWLESSLLASRFYRAFQKYRPAIDLERSRQARLVVHLADQLYRREHDGNPPPSPAVLVGPYLKDLPEGHDEKP